MKLFKFTIVLALLSHVCFSDEIHRYGTTAANFLEIGVGSQAIAMGEARVKMI